MGHVRGGVPKRSTGADCKSAGLAFVGSNPTTTDIPIYHTNVMMSLGTDTALVCFDVIKEKELSLKLRSDLVHSGRAVIDVSIDQMNQFLGNALEVRNKNDEKYLLMSETAERSLTYEQKEMIKGRLN